MGIFYCPKCKKQREHLVNGRTLRCLKCGGETIRPSKGSGRWREKEPVVLPSEKDKAATQVAYFQTYDKLPGQPAEYRKKTTIRAVRLWTPFEVVTLEGPVRGKAGDWLAKGVNGELYPINAEVFEKTYEEVKKVD
jgi:hypothetical protein